MYEVQRLRIPRHWVSVSMLSLRHFNVVSSQGVLLVKAGNSVTLNADDEIKLLAAKNTADQHSTNSNRSGSLGLSFGTDGLLFTASASGGRGKADAITSTQKAIDDGVNRFATGGTLTTSDIQNQASYKASSVGVSVGTGMSLDGKLAPQGTGTGFGKDSGNASSTTTAAISGVAGNKDARTGDAESGIQKIFDADKVQKDIDAQVRITQTFGQQASKAIGDYAAGKTREAAALRDQADKERDPERIRQLKAQAQALEDQWGDHGTLRLTAHTLVGGLTGGASGAAGAAAGTLTAPEVARALNDADVAPALSKTLTAIASTAAGGIVGGSAGAGAALNEVTNNWLSHADAEQLKRLKQKQQNGQCNTGCEKSISELELLDNLNNRLLLNACVNGTKAECTAQIERDPAARQFGVDNLLTIASARVFSQAGNNANKALASLGSKEQLTQLVLELMPLVGSAESAAQLITGKQSLTGEEASRFWAAVGLVPAAGGMIQRVGNTTADVAKALQAADKAADTAKQPGLINDANRLFKQYADDIETQTGYRLSEIQRTALANEMRTGSHTVTLSPVENKALRSEFDSQRLSLISQWEKQTGEAWPMVEKGGQLVRADAHHVIPVTNAGPTQWWNITPATSPQHRFIHAPGSPLNQLQSGAR